MSLPVKIVGTNGTARTVEAKMHVKEDVPVGVLAYTEPYREFDTRIAPFINSELGANMNVNAAFGGTPVLVHDGEDTVAWTGSNVVGGKVTFDSGDRPLNGTQSVKVNNPALNDVWQFDQGSYLTAANYTAITFAINIDKDWSENDSIILYAWDVAGSSIVGNSVPIIDYIDEFIFDDWQNVVIPFSDLGITTTDFDAIRMEHDNKGAGKSPKFYIDDMQVEETGTPYVFRTETPIGRRYLIDSLRLTFIDNVASTLADGTSPALSYDKILGLNSLANGILIQRTVRSGVTFSLPVQNITDLINVGFFISNVISDGTNTLVTFDQQFPKPLVVYGGDNSAISITVRDDLSSLLGFNAVARGSIEITDDVSE